MLETVSEHRLKRPIWRSLFEPMVSSVPWFVFGTGFLWFGQEIPATSLAGDDDPGPRALPAILASCMLVLAALDLVWSIGFAFLRKQEREAGERAFDESQKRASKTRQVVPVLAIVGYAAAIPLIGFLFATLIFFFAWTKLSNCNWWVSVLGAIAIASIIQVLFAGLFEVVLPRGILGRLI